MGVPLLEDVVQSMEQAIKANEGKSSCQMLETVCLFYAFDELHPFL
jgi:hypothetical protein